MKLDFSKELKEMSQKPDTKRSTMELLLDHAHHSMSDMVWTAKIVDKISRRKWNNIHD